MTAAPMNKPRTVCYVRSHFFFILVQTIAHWGILLGSTWTLSADAFVFPEDHKIKSPPVGPPHWIPHPSYEKVSFAVPFMIEQLANFRSPFDVLMEKCCLTPTPAKPALQHVFARGFVSIPSLGSKSNTLVMP
jgi:hypothetical protein